MGGVWEGAWPTTTHSITHIKNTKTLKTWQPVIVQAPMVRADMMRPSTRSILLRSHTPTPAFTDCSMEVMAGRTLLAGCLLEDSGDTRMSTEVTVTRTWRISTPEW